MTKSNVCIRLSVYFFIRIDVQLTLYNFGKSTFWNAAPQFYKLIIQ